MVNINQFQFKSDQERESEKLIQKARSAAIRFIGLGRKASGRIEDYLRREGYDAEVIQQVLSDLQKDQYIDDERLARRQVRSRSGAKSESCSRLAQRLAQSGLDETAVRAVLNDQPDDRSSAREALTARFGRSGLTSERSSPVDSHGPEGHSPSQRLEHLKICLKMQRFLASRGFSADIAREAVRDFWKGYIDHDDDN